MSTPAASSRRYRLLVAVRAKEPAQVRRDIDLPTPREGKAHHVGEGGVGRLSCRSEQGELIGILDGSDQRQRAPHGDK